MLQLMHEMASNTVIAVIELVPCMLSLRMQTNY